MSLGLGPGNAKATPPGPPPPATLPTFDTVPHESTSFGRFPSRDLFAQVFGDGFSCTNQRAKSGNHSDVIMSSGLVESERKTRAFEVL